MKTYTAKAGEVEHGWFVVDAQNKVLGRLAVQIAMRLRGKHKPKYTPHVDTGDYIVVVNAAKLRVTGRKAERKVYYRHSGYPGGIKETNVREAARLASGARAGERGEGHASQGPARLRDAEEAEDLRRRHASALGAATQEPGDLSMVGDYYYGTGRRKSAVARVFLKPGKGGFVVNGKPMDQFFARETGRMVVRQPLELTKNLPRFDILVNVYGGGESGQAGAVRHGISRALIEYDAGLKPPAQRGGSGDARCARGRAKEGRTAQGAGGASSTRNVERKHFRNRKAACGRLFVFLGRMSDDQGRHRRRNRIHGRGAAAAARPASADVELRAITSRKEAGTRGHAPCSRACAGASISRSASQRAEALRGCDVVFFATPNGVAMSEARALLDAGARVIDLSADFRIQDVAEWERWYKLKHAAPELVREAVYGLSRSESRADPRRAARGQPGLLSDGDAARLPAAGRGGVVDTRSPDRRRQVRRERRRAQGRAAPELFRRRRTISWRTTCPVTDTGRRSARGSPRRRRREVGLVFIPHLTPMIRGIHATLYARITREADFQKLFEKRYAREPFVDVMPAGSHPDTRSVRAANMCRIARAPAAGERGKGRHAGRALGDRQPGQGRRRPGGAEHEPDVRPAGGDRARAAARRSLEPWPARATSPAGGGKCASASASPRRASRCTRQLPWYWRWLGVAVLLGAVGGRRGLDLRRRAALRRLRPERSRSDELQHDEARARALRRPSSQRLRAMANAAERPPVDRAHRAAEARPADPRPRAGERAR